MECTNTCKTTDDVDTNVGKPKFSYMDLVKLRDEYTLCIVNVNSELTNAKHKAAMQLDYYNGLLEDVNKQLKIAPDMWKGRTSYERELTPTNFKLCTKILKNLPFSKMSDDVETNMITVRRKTKISEHPYFQIWRVNDEQCSFVTSSNLRFVDPTKIELNDFMYSGEYTIEIYHGVDSVNLDECEKKMHEAEQKAFLTLLM